MRTRTRQASPSPERRVPAPRATRGTRSPARGNASPARANNRKAKVEPSFEEQQRNAVRWAQEQQLLQVASPSASTGATTKRRKQTPGPKAPRAPTHSDDEREQDTPSTPIVSSPGTPIVTRTPSPEKARGASPQTKSPAASPVAEVSASSPSRSQASKSSTSAKDAAAGDSQLEKAQADDEYNSVYIAVMFVAVATVLVGLLFGTYA